jgi:hypothetical protein
VSELSAEERDARTVLLWGFLSVGIIVIAGVVAIVWIQLKAKGTDVADVAGSVADVVGAGLGVLGTLVGAFVGHRLGSAGRRDAEEGRREAEGRLAENLKHNSARPAGDDDEAAAAGDDDEAAAAGDDDEVPPNS